MKKTVIVGLVVGASLLSPAAMIDVTAENFESCRTMTGGNVYRFMSDIEYAATNGMSAMTVASKATVHLCVPKGVTVTLKGGDAIATTGAGAGIEVPTDASFYVYGEGKLVVKGGDAASGQKGIEGGDGRVIADDPFHDDDDWCNSGGGGMGGDGGGGAAAGIGGRGGYGGRGGEGGKVVSCEADKNSYGGQPGSDGKPGTHGGDCGYVYFYESVTVEAFGGKAGSAGGAGGAVGAKGYLKFTNYYGAWGGGGGGGGGAGYAAADIGWGGSGGNGGGGGGSGIVDWWSTKAGLDNCEGTGLGGTGGGGFVPGVNGHDNGPSHDTTKGISGGVGGSVATFKGKEGDSRTVMRFTSSAMINGVNVMAGVGTGWGYDAKANTAFITADGQYITDGDTKVKLVRAEDGPWPVTLLALPTNAAVEVSGLQGVGSLRTDGDGVVKGLFLSDATYGFAAGGLKYAFTVSGKEVTAMDFSIRSMKFRTMSGSRYLAVTSGAGTGSGYRLKRGSDLSKPVSEWSVVAEDEATDTSLTLIDPDPPVDRAFYCIEH